jgi:hypothetical protein
MCPPVLEAKVKQSEMLEVGLRMSAFKARRIALAVLTPEQREKAEAAHEKRMHELMRGPHDDDDDNRRQRFIGVTAKLDSINRKEVNMKHYAEPAQRWVIRRISFM